MSKPDTSIKICLALGTLLLTASCTGERARESRPPPDLELTSADGPMAVLRGVPGHCVTVFGTRSGEPTPGVVLRGILDGYATNPNGDVVGDQTAGKQEYRYMMKRGQMLRIRMFGQYQEHQQLLGMKLSTGVPTDKHRSWTLSSSRGSDHYRLDVYDYNATGLDECK